MTLEDIKNYVYFRTNSDSTLFPAADQLISINRWLHKIWSMMIDSVDSWDIDDASRTDYAIMTTPLVASQRDYTIPASFKAVKIKRVDVTYDGTNYVKVEPWDSGLSTVGLGNNALTDANFSTSAPFYDLLGNAIFLYPLPTAAHRRAVGGAAADSHGRQRRATHRHVQSQHAAHRQPPGACGEGLRAGAGGREDR
jgi:hypothetical protein